MANITQPFQLTNFPLTTKKANRNTFTKLLASNIKSLLKGEEFNLKFDRVRMYIECNNAEVIARKLEKVFGIHSIVICHKVNTNVEDEIYYEIGKKLIENKDPLLNELIDKKIFMYNSIIKKLEGKNGEEIEKKVKVSGDKISKLESLKN